MARVNVYFQTYLSAKMQTNLKAIFLQRTSIIAANQKNPASRIHAGFRIQFARKSFCAHTAATPDLSQHRLCFKHAQNWTVTELPF